MIDLKPSIYQLFNQLTVAHLCSPVEAALTEVINIIDASTSLYQHLSYFGYGLRVFDLAMSRLGAQFEQNRGNFCFLDDILDGYSTVLNLQKDLLNLLVIG